MAESTKRPVLAVIDDDEAVGRLIAKIFQDENFDVRIASNGVSGLDLARDSSPDVVLLDLNLPDLDGLQVLERLKTELPSLSVVMLTASQDVRSAVRATHLGAYDYVTKPFVPGDLVVTVRRAAEASALRREVSHLRRQVGEDGAERLRRQMGNSPGAQRVVDQVARVAASDFTVLVLGETGTGKELIAQAIHQLSARRGKPLAALDCGSDLQVCRHSISASSRL